MSQIQTKSMSGRISIEGIEYEYNAVLFRNVYRLGSGTEFGDWMFGTHSELSFIGREPPDALLGTIEATIAEFANEPKVERRRDGSDVLI